MLNTCILKNGLVLREDLAQKNKEFYTFWAWVTMTLDICHLFSFSILLTLDWRVKNIGIFS